MPKIIGNQKKTYHNELDQVLKECEESLSHFINQHKKIHQLVHNSANSYHDLYFDNEKKELDTIRSESKKRASDNNAYYSWVKEQKTKINVKTKFFALSFSAMGKFIGKHNIEPPVTQNKKTEISEASLLPLDISQISSTGRPSIGVPSNIFEQNDDFGDFLSRFGRSLPSKCKLDNLSLDTSSTSVSETQHLKDNFVNERYLTVPPAKLAEDTPNVDENPDPSLSGLDSTESELLEDVVAPDISLNFTMSGALNAYEKEREAWLKYAEDIQTLEYKQSMIQQCVDIVWNVIIKAGYTSENDALSWRGHLELYSAPKLFEENSDHQKLYNSEWLATLGDVFAIGSSMFAKNKTHTLPMEEEKNIFFNLCKNKIAEACRSTRVENTSRQINWDNEAHRKYAHDLVLESFDQI